MPTRIRSTSRADAIAFWVLTLVLGAITVFASRTVPMRLSPSIAFVLIWPLGAIACLIAAIRATVRATQFRSELVVDSVPVPLGGALRAYVELTPRAAERLSRARVIRMALTCFRRSPGRRSNNISILWQDTAELPPSGTRIPVEFDVPPDVEPTGPSSGGSSIFWRVDVDAELPGIDHHAQFPLTVAGHATASSRFHAAPRTVHPPIAPVQTIATRETPAGLEFAFPRSRMIGRTMLSAALTVFFAAITAFGIWGHAPTLFAAVLIAFVAFMAYQTLDSAFGTSTVVAGPNGVTVQRRVIVARAPISIGRGEIERIVAAPRQRSSAQTLAYYDLQLVTKSGRTISIGKYVQDKHEAESIVARILERAVDSAGARSSP